MSKRGECGNCGSAKNKGRCPNCIVSAVLLELVKPISEDWDSFGRQLRGMRSLSHRLLNAGMLGLVSDLYAFEAKKRAGKTDPDEKPKLYAYPHITAERDSYAAWCRNKGQQSALAASDKRAEADKKRSEEKRNKLLEEAKELENEVVRLRATAELVVSLPATLLANINHTVNGKFVQWLKARDERLPMYKRKSPILLPKDACVVLEVEDDAVRLNMKLRSVGATKVLAVPVSGSAWRAMRSIASEEAKAGDGKVSYDEKKKKWLLRLSITRPRPKPTENDPKVVLAVNRGRYNFLYAVSNLAKGGQVIYPGSNILRFKQQHEAKKRDLKTMRHHRGQGARGHGRNRFFASENKLGDQEKNFVRTACQQAVAELRRQADKIGAGTIVIEDFTSIEDEDLRYVPSWPWYQLKQAVMWMCEQTGRTLVEVPSEYLSSQCPRCQHLVEGQVNVSTGTFRCKSCGYARESDFVACFNMLKRSEADMGAWKKSFLRHNRLKKETTNPPNEEAPL